MQHASDAPQPVGFYHPLEERDACGVGFVSALNGRDKGILEHALHALSCLSHRGARGADGTGDGAGVTTEVPTQLLRDDADLPGSPERFGVGVFFLPRDGRAEKIRRWALEALEAERVPFLAWRPVPVNPQALGERARESRPDIVHLLAGPPAGLPGTSAEDEALAFDRVLYRVRRRIEAAAARGGLGGEDGVYIASFSCRSLVYKGLLMASQLPEFYLDLVQPAYRTRFALYHQRYSTNTTSVWQRAQPFRLLAHNGEINTLQGNVNWMRAREAGLRSPHWEGVEDVLRPVIDERGSDSAMLDNALELLTLSGRDILHSMMMLIPEAWEGIADIDSARRNFYRYHACLLEAWDGPAGVVFADGRYVGAALDRNGLRPMRFTVTEDGLVLAGSEVGAFEVPVERVQKLGRLGPGQMIAVDLAAGRLLLNDEIKRLVAAERPYGEWLDRELVTLPAAAPVGAEPATPPAPELTRQQTAFGYTADELSFVVKPMVEKGKEPVGSMGDDTPQAVLSYKPRPLFHYFKERFAEVTNPAIDHLRERLVFSLLTLLGPRGNLLDERPEAAHLLELPGPVLLERELQAVRGLAERDPAFRIAELATLFPVSAGPDGLLQAIHRLVAEAEAAVDAGGRLLILSDRGVGPDQAPIPSLMAVGAVHHGLIRAGKRMQASLIVESGEPREVHHFAALLGYGANAIVPYLALATARHFAEDGRVMSSDDGHALTPLQAAERFRAAVHEGLLKIMSKMGISTLESYTGAQIFEAVGLNREIIELCFRGTASRVEGNGFRDLAANVLYWHGQAFPAASRLVTMGYYRSTRDGEFHEFNPPAVKHLHEAVRLGQTVYDLDGYEKYKEFARLTKGHGGQLRDLLDFTSDRAPIPVEEVEPIEAITRRFSTGNMSLGALSPEAHETLAIALNRLGGRSASGEGGEDPSRYWTEKNSAVKQVASGRFGVTPAYLASGVELQIKIAQGSKPGEGGQVPGHKVTEYIARIRHTVPGVSLISPPPHHDIYSIEDLAQLIYDLKQINPDAEVSVKLVCETGVGIIAAGVAKGYADIILLSGNSGGTGSSPLNSIKNAGLPWEIGLAETQQTLLANGLRERVALRVDGGLRTGEDVLKAAILGADEYSFGTIAMIAEGCIMARTCHTNRCPVGVATQDEELRAKFPGVPENVMNYFLYVAQDVRERLAALGYRSLDEVIGRTELLRPVRTGHPAADRLVLTPLLEVPAPYDRQPELPRHRVWTRNPLPPEERLDERILEHFAETIRHGRLRRGQAPAAREPLRLAIRNSHRTVGANVSYAIARQWRDEGLPEGSVAVEFEGAAGQSFGAFLSPGMRFTLIGQANDYVGKGMAGGEIVIRPPAGFRQPPHENVIVGNTCLYGATKGRFFAAGLAGERFAIRNSGALAVVEGVGDHGCEYMTGGTVVILGPIGYNFGAGMTGGEAFIFDEAGHVETRLNRQLVEPVPLDAEDEKRLHRIVLEHYRKTGSPRAWALLSHWQAARRHFVHILPSSQVAAIEAANEGAAGAK